MKKIILGIVAFTTLVFASDIENVKKEFDNTSEKIIKTIENKKLSSKEKIDKITQLITPAFDFRLMAKLSLGKTWKTLDKKTQNEFVDIYVNRMKKSYSSKIDKYSGGKIFVNSIKQTKKTRMVLDTTLSGDNKLHVVYKLHKPKKPIPNKNRWLIYDVVVDGISIIKTDRNQFRSVLRDSSIKELMKKLQK